MKGSLHFSSTLGHGTTASIRLPLELIASPDDPKHTSIRRRVLSDELSNLFKPLSLSRHNSKSSGKRDADDEEEDVETASLGSKARTETRRDSYDSGRTSGATSPAPSADDSSRPPTPVPEQWAAVRVLIVDDNQIARRILATFLKNKRIPFAEAKDGQDAVNKFVNFRPNLVWCDVQMPVMDGIEATRRMREYEEEQGWPRSRIVAISGLSSDLGSHASVLESGQVDEWLTKVCTWEQSYRV